MANIKGHARIGGYSRRRYRPPVAMEHEDHDEVRLTPQPEPEWKKLRCRYGPCGQKFWSRNRFLRYCSEKCRAYHFMSSDYEAFQGNEWVTQRNAGRAIRG